MLRQIITVSLLSLGGWSPVSADPIYQNSNFNELTNECVGNSAACVVHNTINSVNINNDSVVFQKDEEENFTNIEKALLEEARGKKKKGYGRIFLIMAGVAKATILYAMIHAVAALAGKALIVAKVALAIATAVALKKALEHPEKTSYEIVKHPHHSYVNTHSTSVDYEHDGGDEESGGYRRRRRRVR